MRLTRGLVLKGAALAIALGLALGGGAVWGGIGRHSARFPLNLSNQAADSIWARYQEMKGETAFVPTGDDVTLITMFTSLRGRVFQIPLADRGGEGGALTSVGNTLLLMAHDGRFFAGTAEDGFRQFAGITPPPNGYQDYYDATHRPPYDPSIQNYANFRYNDIVFFEAASGAALLISYTHFDGAKACYTSRIARFDISGADVSIDDIAIGADDWRLLFETQPCLPLNEISVPSIYVQESGGRLVLETETNTIYMAGGNYDAINPNGEAPISHDPSNDYGKVLAIDLDSGASRHISFGHRNPQGIAKDRAGRLWIVEHGPRGGDELNLIVDGRNYGWPYAAIGTAYNHRPFNEDDPGARHAGFEPPLFGWAPSIGPSTVIEVEGFNPAWDGDLLVGALRGQKLVHLRLADGRVVFAEDIPMGQRIRHLHQHTDGSIAVWNGKNQLIIFTSDELADTALIAEMIVDGLDAPADVRSAVQLELNECMQCHSLLPGDNATAPSLARVFGSGVGSGDYPYYSPALANAGGVWSRERLDSYLSGPNDAIPGTIMPDPEISDDEVRAALVEALAALRRTNDGVGAYN